MTNSARDRRLLAIVQAYLDGDPDRVDVLARDHLADHPDDVLAAFVAHLASQDSKETS